MHKLLDYICSELENIERKAERDDSLTMTEIQYADTLLHMKKNLLKSEMLTDEIDGYSRGYSNARGRGSNARRDSRGRYADGGYSRGTMVETIRDMMEDAPDDNTRLEFQRFIDKLERR